MKDLSEKIAWVSGGGSGVGASIALSLAMAGAKVIISGRTENSLSAVSKAHDNISSMLCDFTNRASVDACCQQIKNDMGQLDIVVANAGIASSAPFGKESEDTLRSLWEVNVLGVFNMWQSALPLMRSASDGRLIVIASVAGLKGYPYVSGYCSAKHAVVGLMKSVAQELAKTNITANAICPGYVDTPMLDRSVRNIANKTGCSEEQARDTLRSNNPQQRFLLPEEVAQSVIWLSQPESKSVNGQALSLSGGEV